MKNYTPLTFVLLFFLFGGTIDAQKRALGKPQIFERPLQTESFYLSPTKEKIKAPWIVICDREGAQTFANLSKTGVLENPKEKLKFKNWFYVSEEKDQHIRLFKGQVNSASLKVEGATKDYGWIHKKDVLLWTSGLVDAKTRIDLKAFLLNKASEVKRIMQLDKKEIVKIYKGPETGETIGNKTIYEFYFVFKKEGDKYLLSKNVNINPQHNIEDLIGWVRQGRIEAWNTRICLEPNFEEPAFLERKDNTDFQLIAYGDEASAISHSESGRLDNSQAIWKNDPVTLKPTDLASDGKRFKGGVVRFPMLSNRKKSGYFRSGVIGELDIKYTNTKTDKLPEVDWSLIMQSVQDKEVARRNFDILFVIEGTKSMSWYKETIAKAIKEASQEFVGVPNVRYGVAVYRDTPEKAENKLFDIKKMHSSVDTITEFVSNIEFARWRDNDNYAAMYYGINQAMIESNMNDQHTNVVYVFGNNADLKAERSRKGADECFLQTDVVAAKLADFNAHVIGIQCKNADREGAYFIKNMRSLMLESANVQFRAYNGISDVMSDLQVANPELTDDNKLKNGANIGMIISPNSGSSMSEKDIVTNTSAAAKNIYDFVEGFWQNISKIMEDGASVEEISAGPFAPAAARIMFDIVEEGKKRGITQRDLEKIAKDKYKLYTEVFIPKRINGADYDVCSQVLFMPENDLEDYIDVLDQLAIDLMKPEDELRKGLHRALVTLVEQYTGSKTIGKEYSTEDLRALMQGVTKEGIKKSEGRDFAIENVLSEKRMPIQDVRNFSTSMVSKARTLKRISKKGKKHEFSYTSENNTYFWIPVEYTF